MDPLTVAVASVIAFAGVGAGSRWRVRARRAEAQAAQLRRELQSERHAASHDPLTGLPNRRAFYESARMSIMDPARRPLAVIVLDLDDFKSINDKYGHAIGDDVLITVARRFRTYAGKNVVARLGGDEFVGLLAIPSHDPHWAAAAPKKLSETLSAPMPVAGRSLVVTASVGLALLKDNEALDSAVRRADAAMYRDKARLRRCGNQLPPRSATPPELTTASIAC